METTLHPGHNAPEFDTNITDFVDSFNHNPYPSSVRLIGIAIVVDGSYVPYRTVHAFGMPETNAILDFLYSLGMEDIDGDVARKDQFDSVFGFPIRSTH